MYHLLMFKPDNESPKGVYIMFIVYKDTLFLSGMLSKFS
ncbi:hypothetical protein J2X97_001661 [Epilithonimonas hungarica]|nr:hypothetical protein [Epilithonimonas hungarica]